MNISNSLPAVLTFESNQNSISMERSLNQIKNLLLDMPSNGNCALEDSIHASIDDIELMLKAIVR